MGKLVKADLTVTNASGELYADDALAEKVDMFASGSLALETDEQDGRGTRRYSRRDQGYASSEVTDSDGDVAPRGGLCYYKVIIRGGVRYFKGVFHPLVKAILGNDSAATKGSSITFGTSATTFTVFRCNSGAWRITKEFTTESEWYRVVRYQARQSGRLISARDGRRARTARLRFGNWMGKGMKTAKSDARGRDVLPRI